MTSTAVITEVVAVLGVLGVGSILGQYVGSAKDRRQARAGVLSALANTESGRWSGPDPKMSLDEFQTSLRELQTAALIARLPRDAVREYAVLAQAARWVSQESWEQAAEPVDGSWGIDAHLAQGVREAARAITVMAWTSRPTHAWRWRRAQHRIDQILTKLQSKETKDAVDRARRTGFMRVGYGVEFRLS